MTVNSNQFKIDSNLKAYISAGCNKTPQCVDWGNNNLICFGTCNSIAVYDPNFERVLLTIPGHKNRVNSVSWVKLSSGGSETELVSASSDKTVIVWSLINGEILKKAVLVGHELSVNIVDAISFGSPSEIPSYTVVATASADSTVKFWTRNTFDDAFSCETTLDLGSGLCLSLTLVVLPSCKNPIAAIGTDDSKIHLYSKSEKLLSLVGHEDWVRCLQFTADCFPSVLLASGSQDSTVRLWKLKPVTEKKKMLNEVSGEFKEKEHIICVDNIKFVVSLESVLMGHEGWVYGLQWMPGKGGKCLATCSLDRTILLWKPDTDSGVWLETTRLGQLGGNTLGFLCLKFSPNADAIISNSYQGALHMWIYQEGDIWKSIGCASGHVDSAVDVCWEAKGRYLLSCSLDQTTRLHSVWRASPTKSGEWFEMSRPQVHGHAMAGLAGFPNFTFASCSEEKVVRVFKAPQNILQNLCNLMTTITVGEISEDIPLGAAVPSLGLSNKAVFTDLESPTSTHPKDEFSDGYFTPQNLTEPPTEDNLTQNTLWPEVMKLYGHGYEVYTLASSWKGDFLATACKASTPEHAKIILWSSNNWEQVCELEGHTLTVTQMEFSKDDSFLLSVSRDRTWCLFKRTDSIFNLFRKSEKSINPHSRIIWTCCWTYDSCFFATGSRDGRVAVWSSEGLLASAPLNINKPITAVATPQYIISFLQKNSYVITMGTEEGGIITYLWSSSSWTVLFNIPSHLGHHLTVKRLSFRPVPGFVEDPTTSEDNSLIQLASCSLDYSVRVFSIDFKKYTSSLTNI